MYFKDFLLGLRRRWYVALVGLVLTAGLAAATTLVVPTTYTSTTSLLLLPPRSAIGWKGNPYLNLSGLTQALEVLSTRINASEPVQGLAEQHSDAIIEVGPDLTSTGPILLITATAESPEESSQLRDQLAQFAPQMLITMQNELRVQPSSRITVSMLAQDPEPSREIKSQLRAVIVVVALAGGGTILAAGYLDFLLALRSGAPVRRGRRRPRAQVVTWWDTPPTRTENISRFNGTGSLRLDPTSTHDGSEENGRVNGLGSAVPHRNSGGAVEAGMGAADPEAIHQAISLKSAAHPSNDGRDD